MRADLWEGRVVEPWDAPYLPVEIQVKAETPDPEPRDFLSPFPMVRLAIPTYTVSIAGWGRERNEITELEFVFRPSDLLPMVMRTREPSPVDREWLRNINAYGKPVMKT